MTVLKLNGRAGALLVALAMLAASSHAALANTTKLICHLTTNADIMKEDGATTVELNEAKRSVTAHISSARFTTPGVSGGYPASTIGPQAATFSDDTITFDSYTLNRLTGELINKANNWKWACQATKKQF